MKNSESNKNIYEFPASKKERKKILKSQVDPRLKAVYRFRWLFGFLFVVSFACFLILNYNFFMVDNLQKVYSYIDIGTKSETGDMKKITFPGSFNQASLFGSGLVITEKGSLSVCLPGNITQLQLNLNYADPSIDTSNKYILCYKKGGNDITLANAAAELGSLTTKSNILTANLGRNGYFSVVTDETGYKSAVTVYNSDLNQTYKWSSSEYYIMSSAVSDDGKNLATTCFKQEGASINSKVIFFKLSSDKKQKEIPLGEMLPLKVDYLTDGAIAVLCDGGVFIIDEKGDIIGQKTFSASDLISYKTSDGVAAVALKSYSKNARTNIYCLNTKGNISTPISVRDDLHSLSITKNRLAVLTTNKLTVYDNKGELVFTYNDVLNAKNIILKDDNNLYLLFAKFALIISPLDGDNS